MNQHRCFPAMRRIVRLNMQGAPLAIYHHHRGVAATGMEVGYMVTSWWWWLLLLLAALDNFVRESVLLGLVTGAP